MQAVSVPMLFGDEARGFCCPLGEGRKLQAFTCRRFEVDPKPHESTLGMGSAHIESGDQVVVLVGCGVPVLPVLRSIPSENKRGQEYVLIEECYVDGFMDDEILEQGVEPLPGTPTRDPYPASLSKLLLDDTSSATT
jgi:hypothetical protein